MSTKAIVTRFAPSPTGYLHIGGARTALFNWLYARGRGGKFLLRIEDTDRARSTEAATQAILNGLTWLGLDWDGEAFSQFEGADRHREVANTLLENGGAYKCFSTEAEIEDYRNEAEKTGNPLPFQSPWRDADPSSYPDRPYVIRLRSPREGGVKIKDKVQKTVSWAASSFDDLVLVRSDGTPTYMLAVVVDDHDMGVTHIIRGDDHLINAGRQSLIYAAMGWEVPEFAHIPLIHGEDGKKLSKRHGATGVEEYQAMGYLPEAMRNYLARLGWSHGNDELFTTKQALDWFDFDGLGKSPSRLDFKKLDNVSAFHIKNADPNALTDATLAYLKIAEDRVLSGNEAQKLRDAMPILTDRAKRLGDIFAKAHFLFAQRPVTLDERASQVLDLEAKQRLLALTPSFQNVTWTRDELEAAVTQFTEANNLKFGQIAQPLRALLSGSTNAPSAFDMMVHLGRDETLARIEDQTRGV